MVNDRTMLRVVLWPILIDDVRDFKCLKLPLREG